MSKLLIVLNGVLLCLVIFFLTCKVTVNPEINTEKIALRIDIPSKPNNLLWKINENVPIKITIVNVKSASSLKIFYGDDITKYDSIPLNSQALPDTTFEFFHVYSDTGIKSILAIAYPKHNKLPASISANLDIGQKPIILNNKMIQTMNNSTPIIDSPFVVFVQAQEFRNTTYRWFQNGIEKPMKKTNTVDFPKLSPADSGTYFCLVSNRWGQDSSLPYLLNPITLITPPTITVQPVDQQVTIGNPATFFINAKGPNLHYTWRKNGLEIANAINPTYITGPCTLGDNNAVFTCVVYNFDGDVTSQEAKLTVVSLEQRPVITEHPTDVVLFPDEKTIFTVKAQGTNLKYKWFKNDICIIGAEMSHYETLPVTLNDSGAAYHCIVYNTAGTDTSNKAIITIKTVQLPTITIQPQDAVVSLGVSAQFSISAVGVDLTYQWKKNQIDIPNAIQPTYITPPTIKTDNNSKFQCLVTNIAGTVYSLEANLTVTEQVIKPEITVHPQNQNVLQDSNVTFSVTASGTALIYQWQRNCTDITGANQAAYTLTGAKITDNGAKFRCIVSNSLGSVTSAEATLTVHDQVVAPVITVQPQNLQVTQGESATFSLTAVGINCTYQWYKNNVAINGANLTAYTHANAQLADNNTKFTCIVSNIAGSVTSSEANLTVTDTTIKPVITSHPQDRRVLIGENASFFITATGNSLIHQWQKNGTDIPSANAAIYILYNAQLPDNGAVFNCIVSNSSGSVKSNNATLIISDTVKIPVITIQPQNQAVTEGSNATFTTTVTGTNLTYQWKRSGNPITSATLPFYTLINTAISDNGAKFTCVISNGGGSVTTKEAILTVTQLVQLPVITDQPDNVNADEGKQATFSITATGTDLKYQWAKNGTAISGATFNSYTIQSVVTGDNGATFTCMITNSAGSVTSNAATLTVTSSIPVIDTQPLSQTVKLGRWALFTIKASGSNLTFQWYRNNYAISGATDETYQTHAAYKSQNCDRFKCKVSNSAGHITSQEVYLYVHWAPEIWRHPQSITVEAGQRARFWIQMRDAGNPRMYYQWYCYNKYNTNSESKETVISSGRGNPTLNFRAQKRDDGNSYFCRIWNSSFPSIRSRAARLTVTDPDTTNIIILSEPND